MTDKSDKSKEIDDSIKNHPDIKALIAASPARKMADIKLKKEITDLIDSGSTENKIKALEIIDTCGCSFPSSSKNYQKASRKSLKYMEGLFKN